MRKRKILAGVLSTALVLGGLTLPENVKIGGSVVETSLLKSAEAAEDEVTYADSVTLYGMTSTYEDVLFIPSDYAQSYQIEDEDAVSYTVYSGSSVTVSEDGLVEAAYETWYKLGNVSSNTYMSGAETYTKMISGDSVVEVTTGTGCYFIAVTVEDYTDVYVDQVIDDYIANNISLDMTDMELMDAICSFPASYDYSAYHSSAKTMILYEGGDCWASTDLIIETCEKLGISAWSRDGSGDTGAGSNHMNAMVEYNGTYYLLDGGYNGTAPRYYYVEERSSLFSTRSIDGGLEVYQYDGPTTSAYEIDIPAEIDGETVVSIAESFVTKDNYLTKVTIPDTVTSIGDKAFYFCYQLTSINIPASVTEIGDMVFSNCNELSDFTCDEDNAYYTMVDGVLYDKDMTTVYYAPYVSEVKLPDTVKTIAANAFYSNDNLTYVYIPASVTSIGDYAFPACTSLTNIFFEEGDKLEIGVNAFYCCSSLKEIAIPSSVTSISDYTFGACYDLARIEIPASVTSVGDGAFVYSSDLTDVYYLGTEEEWNEITIGTDNTYLTSATIHYNQALPVAQTISANITSSDLIYGETSQITASGIGDITYASSNENVVTVDSTGLVTTTGAGTAVITVTASGDLIYDVGSTTLNVTVEKADQTVTASMDDTTITIASFSQITASGIGTITYSSSDSTIVYVGKTNGYISGAGLGTAVITVTASGNSCYNSASTTITINVVKDEQTITASITESNLSVGDIAFIEASANTTLTYTSSDTNIVSIAEFYGWVIVTAEGAGSATITVEAEENDYYNSASTTLTVVVTGQDYLLGDVNEDGEIDYLDAMTALRYDAELVTLDETQLLAGDVNLDGTVDSLDAILILRYDADLIDSF